MVLLKNRLLKQIYFHTHPYDLGMSFLFPEISFDFISHKATACPGWVSRYW